MNREARGGGAAGEGYGERGGKGRAALVCYVWAAGCDTRFPGATARQRHRCQGSWCEPASGGVAQTRALASLAR